MATNEVSKFIAPDGNIYHYKDEKARNDINSIKDNNINMLNFDVFSNMYFSNSTFLNLFNFKLNKTKTETAEELMINEKYSVILHAKDYAFYYIDFSKLDCNKIYILFECLNNSILSYRLCDRIGGNYTKIKKFNNFDSVISDAIYCTDDKKILEIRFDNRLSENDICIKNICISKGLMLNSINDSNILKDNYLIFSKYCTNDNLINNKNSSILKLHCTITNNNEFKIDKGGYAFINIPIYKIINNDINIFAYDNNLNNTNYSISYRICKNNSVSDKEIINITNSRLSSNFKYIYHTVKISEFDNIYTNIQIRIDNRSGNDYIIIKKLSVSDGIYTPLNYYENTDIAYVSTTGNDTINDGTYDNPYLTVNTALNNGATDIRIFGGKYNQKIDLSLSKKNTIKLMPANIGDKIEFTSDKCIVLDNEEKYLDSSKVYFGKISDDLTSQNNIIFHDGIPDESTLINLKERNPLQRGVKYRCYDTKIYRCNSELLVDAISEIDSSDTFKYFYDKSTKNIYFSRPASITKNNPLCKGVPGGDIIINTNNKTVFAFGINAKYLSFNIQGSIGSRIVDCKVENACNGGGFIYSNCIDAKFIRCEASSIHFGVTGDGFNAHGSLDKDPYTKQVTCNLYNCWSHDNNDDGYSDHERSEITIDGGLYEYNGKGGITPSYGTHCSCYNVLSRKNWNGFNYVGDASAEEGGEGGQLLCINCISEENGIKSFGWGFSVSGLKNSGRFVNCISINNKIGYHTDSNIELINCYSFNDISIKSGDGAILISNGKLVI